MVDRSTEAIGGSRFDYVIERIAAADVSADPFRHVYLDEVFTPEDFAAITSATEIDLPPQHCDEDLFDTLFEHDYKIISFPGCSTDREHYVRWHRSRGDDRAISSSCEGFGMTLRLETAASPIITELMAFLNGAAFRRALLAKFAVADDALVYDAGIQKYLDGYEISPHPDVRKKALTFMVNVNPAPDADRLDHHTRYLRFRPEYRYVGAYWEANHQHDRCWVPWEWCEIVSVQERNNTMVVFAPDDDTLHAVKADYDHLPHQRTQLYGNFWHAESITEGTPRWEDFVIAPTPVRPGVRARAVAAMPAPVSSALRRLRPAVRGNVQKRFFER